MHNILVVDDTKINIDILVDILGDNYNVLVALNGEKALQIVKKRPIDLILLDIIMPELDGYEVCKRLKQDNKTKHIPVIFITAMSEEDDIEKAYDVGGVDYITKPFKTKELLSRVKTQLNIQDFLHKEVEYNKHLALSELIHNIAHQWRQPLSTISTVASGMLLEQELGLLTDEKITEHCNQIVDKSKYLSSIIESFKLLVEDSTNLKKLNLKELIEQNYYILFEDIDKKLQIDIDIQDIQIVASPSQIMQVLIAIVTNAKEAMVSQDDAVLIIKGYVQNSSLIINIQDSGGGIDDDVIHKIFEPYFTTSHQSQGKGLGLYVAHNIVKNILHGDIKAYNCEFEYNNKKYFGANFEIILPTEEV